MMINKQFLIGCLLAVMVPSSSHAFTPVVQPTPFELSAWSDISTIQTYYGELESWPHTFVFTVTSTTTLALQAAVGTGGTPVSLLVVREAERGVREVARQTAKETRYKTTRDTTHGIRLQSAPAIAVELGSGLYRAEVSNPENIGKYQLTIGTAPAHTSYWQTVKDTFKVHTFYGSWLTALCTWRVMVLWGGGLTVWYWLRRRKKQKYA